MFALTKFLKDWKFFCIVEQSLFMRPYKVTLNPNNSKILVTFQSKKTLIIKLVILTQQSIFLLIFLILSYKEGN